MDSLLVDKLLANRNERDEPIMSTPPPKALRKTDGGMGLSYVYNSFSVSNGIQQKIANALDLPKWNETTLLAQLAETLSNKSGFKVLRSSDVRKHVIDFEMRDENYLENGINRMNASLFFTLLFINREFNSHLNIDQKITLGNALTFAVWKERMECDIFMQTDEEEEWLDYHSGDFFKKFCSGAHNLFEMLDTKEGITEILQTSPWCGLEQVMTIWENQVKSKGQFFVSKWEKKNQLMGDFFEEIKKTDGKSDLMIQSYQSIEKRKMEDQWFLIHALKRLSQQPPTQKEEASLRKKIIQEIEQIIHTNVAIDAQGEMLALYTEKGIHLIESIRQNPAFKKEMDGMKEYVSTTAAAILSKTGEKLMEKTFNYFVVLPMAIRTLRMVWSRGLFASAEYAMKSTLQNMMGRPHDNFLPFTSRS
jgi:hypothetical protein